jgi:hypothetical protein
MSDLHKPVIHYSFREDSYERNDKRSQLVTKHKPFKI